MIAYARAWQGVGTEEGLKKVWSRVAYATRYGNASLAEALELDQHALQDYIEALSDIVEQENKASRK